MATLEQVDSGEPVFPGPRTVIGRAAGCGWRLVDAGVSGEHARLRWTGEQWTVRDLGSRNGTWVNGRRLELGEEAPLEVGSELQLGTEGQRWVVLDLDPPGEPVPVEPLAPTREVRRRTSLDTVGLRVRASADEEYVEIDVVVEGTAERLTPRAFHDLVLLLARERLAQRVDRSEAEAGWVYMDDLCAMLGRPRERVNVEVFRARQQLAELGIEDAARLFERRAPTRQIRIGVADLEVGAL